ncbi:MAG TPA: polysaccharide biosynthesis tyrosine autokinase [Caulobacteraceae bacterium]|nr:polysaccharide biosynthesis tyrosine autokinase [Caulobacteraceae bacterium]
MVGERDGGSNLWAPADMARRVVARQHENVIAAWEDVQLADASEGSQGIRLLEYWRILWKHKWIIAAAAIIGLAIGFGATLMTPKVYTASTTIEIDREAASPVGNVGDVAPMERLARDQEFFQTQYGLLKSWSLASRVAQAENLANDPQFLHAMGMRPRVGRKAAAGGDQWVVGTLAWGLGVYPVRDSRLVRITFDSPDPNLSARIANAFAQNFIASNLERRFEASAYARNFLEQRLAEQKAKLEESERQLVAYATQQQIIQVTESGGGKDAPPPQSLAATDLGGINGALIAAKANLAQVAERYRSVQSAPGLAAPEILADPTVQQLRGERAKLQSQYNEQLKIYKPDYPDMLQLKAQMDDIDKQLVVAGDTIRRSLRTQYDAAVQQVGNLQGQVDHLKTSVLDERNREIQYNILQREVDTTRTLYDGLLQRYKEVGVAGGITTNNVSVVDPARPPGGPSQPQPMHNLMTSGLTGLGVGVLLAFLLEALDQAVRKPVDVETKLGLPVLGSVPLLQKGVQPLEALSDLRSPFSEAYHSIRSNLAFSTNDGAPRVLAVTSARPEEGKSTTAFALAQGFARVGMRVLLVDLDLRNPSQHKTIGADNRVGASSLLTGAVRLQGAVQPTDWPNMFLIPSGPLPPSPAELLIGPRLIAFVKEAQEHFDIVILDGPPVMGLADAPLIASVAAGAVLTIEAGRTSRAQARSAVKRLRQGNARIFGAILTKFDSRKQSYGYGYAYAYEYDYQYGRKEEPAAANRPSVLTDRSRKTPPAA